MAVINSFAFWRHLRAEPNQYILHYSKGRSARKGAGLAYWFLPLSAAVAQLPVEDCETTFVLNERSNDYQEVHVQCTITYRFVDYEKAAARTNFAISLVNGRWLEQPLERLATFWHQRTQHTARQYLTGAPLVEAMRDGAEIIRVKLVEALRQDAEVTAMGLAAVAVQVNQIAPAPEVEKALQTPTRELLQQKADEAVFARRALAVEKERAIKENELGTQIELAKQEDRLIQQKGANQLRQAQAEAEAEMAKAKAAASRDAVSAEAYAANIQTKAQGDAQSRKTLNQVENESLAARLDLYRDAPAKVIAGLALQQLAGKIQNIQHLNLTPDLLAQTMSQFFRDQPEK